MWNLGIATGFVVHAFLDPAQVIRGTHLIPAFSEGRTSILLPETQSVARVRNPSEADDWTNFYVNIFVDRDMLMRHFGHGVGHIQYERQQEIEPDPGMAVDSNDDDTAETEEVEGPGAWEKDDANLDFEDNDDGDVAEIDGDGDSEDEDNNWDSDSAIDSDGYASF